LVGIPCRECPSDIFLDKNGKKTLREKTLIQDGLRMLLSMNQL